MRYRKKRTELNELLAEEEKGTLLSFFKPVSGKLKIT